MCCRRTEKEEGRHLLPWEGRKRGGRAGAVSFRVREGVEMKSHLLHDLCGCQGLTVFVSVLDESTKKQTSCDKAKQGLGFPCLLTF